MIHFTTEYATDGAFAGLPMKHARILWDNLLGAATFTADSEREGFAATRARSPDTVSWWWPEAGGTLTMTLAAGAQIDCVAVAAHSIGTAGASVLVEGLVGAAWVELHPEITPSDDEAIMILFRAVEVSAIRITLDASARVGVVYAGRALAMPQMVYGTAPMLRLTYATDYETNRSQTGQFMGRSIVANGRPFEVTWRHLPEAWVRQTLAGFIMASKSDPFFVALRPWDYPDDVGYVLAAGDINPERMGVRDLVQVSVSGEAHLGPAA